MSDTRYSDYSVEEVRRYLKLLESSQITSPQLCIHLSCYLDRYMGMILKEHEKISKG